MLEHDGWTMVRQTGSHRRFKHPTKPGGRLTPARPARIVWRRRHREAGQHVGARWVAFPGPVDPRNQEH